MVNLVLAPVLPRTLHDNQFSLSQPGEWEGGGVEIRNRQFFKSVLCRLEAGVLATVLFGMFLLISSTPFTGARGFFTSVW